MHTHKTNKYSAVIVIMLPTMGRLEACPFACTPTCLGVYQIALKCNNNNFFLKRQHKLFKKKQKTVINMEYSLPQFINVVH